MSDLCDHGFFLHDCALCQKQPRECDYGSCTDPAITSVPTHDRRGRVVENRPMCERHAEAPTGCVYPAKDAWSAER